MTRIHLLISGRVHGVYFRVSTKRAADALGLAGWVRNKGDGTVEAVAQGGADLVEQFFAWCHDGPPLAVVSTVERVDVEPVDAPEGFDVRPSI
jgi:acylphosphatase